jgi:hypothetical protein
MHDFITPKVFARDPYFSNYNLENLEKLSKHGLQCVPLEDYSFEAPTPCFPWAVFYICGATTGGKSTSEDSFYKSIVGRAADAASTALSMFEGLARFAEEKHDGRHIPPVIAVTFAGAKTTVWLAYCEILDERLRDHVRYPFRFSNHDPNMHQENHTYLGGQSHQDLGCHSILPYH